MATVTQAPPVEATPASPPRVGPEHQGLPMDYAEFIRADFQEGWLYELARGIVIVTRVPGIHHGMIVLRVARLFFAFHLAHPEVIKYQASGSDCRLRFAAMKSDRHPDQAVYLHPYPKGTDLWERWMPDIAVEVVSARGEERDYVTKRQEYLAAGIREYWILDPLARRLMVLINLGESWHQTLIDEDSTYETALLPGLVVNVGDLLGPPVVAEEE
jgi:Uma2 family endonuclease